MITSHKAPKRAGKRIVSVGVALGIALALGTAVSSTAAATPVTAKAMASPSYGDHGHGDNNHFNHGDDDGCVGLLVLLCN